MPPSGDRLDRWHSRREERLSRLPDLRSTVTAGGKRAWYLADELLVADELVGPAHDALAAAGHAAFQVADDEIVPGLRRLRVRGMDVPAAVRRVRDRRRSRGTTDPDSEPVVGLNHVFLSAPLYQGGPFGPPLPAPAATLPSPRREEELPPVIIIDTGVWDDSPLSAAYYEPSDHETETDVDGDGMLDGDVGHANFIAGVILANTSQARVRVIKVLDTFGVCDEAMLANALYRLPDDVQVVNLSLGGFTPDDRPPGALRLALRQALTGKDRVVIAAAGNDGNRVDPFWPAAFTGTGDRWSGQVAAVAAHNGDQLCSWSNAGPWVSLIAPGEDVTSTYINHDDFTTGWAVWSGTSFATPLVAAAVAEELLRDGSATAALARVRATAGRDGDQIRLP